MQQRTCFKRPQTAPSTSTATDATAASQMPSIPASIEHALSRPSFHPPSRPPRPDADMVRDVNAWLDASMSKPSPPLMGGLSYWRTATVVGVRDSADVQHVIPIVQDSSVDRLSTSHGQQMKSLCRRAKTKQVETPLLLRTEHQCTAGWKQTYRDSTSLPLLSPSYEEFRQISPPKIWIRTRSLLHPEPPPPTASTSTQSKELVLVGQHALEQVPPRHGTPATARFNKAPSDFHPRFNTMFKSTARSTDSTRPSTAAASLVREDSLSDVSDAPTYFTGPPPPSYRSRTVSILTTSSFGCIDGMNPVQRQMSQQRAALHRGMRGKLKKIAQNFTTQ